VKKANRAATPWPKRRGAPEEEDAEDQAVLDIAKSTGAQLAKSHALKITASSEYRSEIASQNKDSCKICSDDLIETESRLDLHHHFRKST
jgi:hypothetical protein